MSKIYYSRNDKKSTFSNIIYSSKYEPLIEETKITTENVHGEKEKLTMENNKYHEEQWKFEDGDRTIDMVIVWDESSSKATSTQAVEKRMIFETHLREDGLELEHDYIENKKLHFIKIHAPRETLQRYAEILKLRMPIKDIFNKNLDGSRIVPTKSCLTISRPTFNCFDIEPHVFPECGQELNSAYTQARDYLFDVETPGFFTPAQKARIIRFILERTLYAKPGRSDKFEFGIDRLVHQGVYSAVYPLHDGDLQTPGSMRYNFFHYWASFKNWYKKQPADQLRQYFGVKTALYFIWLGYYTRMLIPASIAGVACFIASFFLLPIADTIEQAELMGTTVIQINIVLFGDLLQLPPVMGDSPFVQLHPKDYERFIRSVINVNLWKELLSFDKLTPRDEVCDGKINGVICPSCDHYCNFVNVTDYCLHTKILFIFDNAMTVVFAIFISFWAAIFLECWKRYSAEITLRWDLTSLDERDENPRPEYAAKLARLADDGHISQHLNFITNATEPKVSFWRHIFLGKFLSLSTMLLLVTLAVAAVIGVTLYHIFARRAMSQGMFSSITATCLNLFCILIFSPIYGKLSVTLTELEMPRTQREFDSSLTLKMYLLEFINHYASIFYIAFFKGQFVGPPSGYYRIFGYRQLECGAGGCMLELTQQLAVIMIGKRAIRSLSQTFLPIFTHKWRRYSVQDSEDTKQWEKDHLLEEGGPRMVFPEYLDMVLQYGFVTIFVSAFPLAPLFALVNNIFEIRIDAKKFLIYQRRPTMRRIKDIGVWFDILRYISSMAVFTNGFIIAFTSNFVPRMVYRLTVGHNYGTVGYLNNSLSYMAIDDLDMENKPNTTSEYCRYYDYREPPWSENKYEPTKLFWVVLAARLGFFIIFENVIMVAVVLVKWLIPDVPQNTQWLMRRKYYLINEAIINHEAQKTHKIIKKKKPSVNEEK